MLTILQFLEALEGHFELERICEPSRVVHNNNISNINKRHFVRNQSINQNKKNVHYTNKFHTMCY